MKLICVLSLNPFFENSAEANRCRTLIEGLSKLGVEINLLITGGYKTKDEFKIMGRKCPIEKIDCHYLNILFHHNIWLRRLNNYILSPLISPIVQRKVIKIAATNPSAIFWTDSNLDSFKLVLKLKRRYPELKTFLELSEFLDIHHFNKGRVIHKLEGDKRHSLFEKEAFYAYDGLALMTTTLMKHYERLPKTGPKLLHLPMTVDLDRFDRSLPQVINFEKPYITFVGVMNNEKEGVDILIKAFSRIAGEFPLHKLYLVGPWHYDTPGHKKMINELGLEKRVFWMGEYNRDEIPAIMKNADLLVLPRPDSKQAQGGFPTKLGEYLATANPVSATSVGEIPDYLVDGESIYFAEPGSVDSFAIAMHRVLSNPEEAGRVGANGRKVAETHFNKEVQAKELYEFLLMNLQSKDQT